MTQPEIEPRLVTDQILARLGTLDGVTVYDGEVRNDDGTTHPPPMEGNDEGRVAPYVVVHPFGPNPTTEQDLTGVGVDIDYTVQLRLSSGFRADTENLLFRVGGLFRGWAPEIEDASCGLFTPPVGFQSGPIQADTSISPPRYWVPLQYRSTISR